MAKLQVSGRHIPRSLKRSKTWSVHPLIYLLEYDAGGEEFRIVGSIIGNYTLSGYLETENSCSKLQICIQNMFTIWPDV